MKRIDKVMEVIGFIEDNLTEKLELDEIAEEVHYSKYHCTVYFRIQLALRSMNISNGDS